MIVEGRKTWNKVAKHIPYSSFNSLFYVKNIVKHRFISIYISDSKFSSEVQLAPPAHFNAHLNFCQVDFPATNLYFSSFFHPKISETTIHWIAQLPLIYLSLILTSITSNPQSGVAAESTCKRKLKSIHSKTK